MMNNTIPTRSLKSKQNIIVGALFLMFALQVVLSLFTVVADMFKGVISADVLGYINTVISGASFIIYLVGPIALLLLLTKKSLKAAVPVRGKVEFFLPKLFAVLGVMFVGQLIATGLNKIVTNISGVDIFSPIQEQMPFVAEPGFLVLSIICTAVLPALLEETLVRGVMLDMLAPHGKVFAVVLTAVLFGVMHMNPIQTVFAVIAGLALGFVTLKTGNIKVAVLAHFINNTISVVLTYVEKTVSLQSAETVMNVLYVILLSLGAASIVFLILVGRKRKKANPEPAPAEAEAVAEAREPVKLSVSMILYFIFAFIYMAILVFSMFIAAKGGFTI